MIRREIVAYGLIGLGALALLARLTDGAGWLWIALVAVALLAAYASQRTYGLLVVGGLLAGTAVGILLQQLFPRCDGVFLIALGAGLFAIDAVDPREPRWPRIVGLGLAVVGLVLALAASGALSSAWFAVLLIVAGALILWRRREAGAFPPPVRQPRRTGEDTDDSVVSDDSVVADGGDGATDGTAGEVTESPPASR